MSWLNLFRLPVRSDPLWPIELRQGFIENCTTKTSLFLSLKINSSSDESSAQASGSNDVTVTCIRFVQLCAGSFATRFIQTLSAAEEVTIAFIWPNYAQVNAQFQIPNSKIETEIEIGIEIELDRIQGNRNKNRHGDANEIANCNWKASQLQWQLYDLFSFESQLNRSFSSSVLCYYLFIELAGFRFSRMNGKMRPLANWSKRFRIVQLVW